MEATREQLVEAFAQWERDYRENPERFQSIVSVLLHETPETYGAAAANTLLAYIAHVQAPQS